MTKTDYVFTCGKECLNVVDQYKYLGLIFTEFMDYSEMAKFVARAAHRALGLIIAKSRVYGGMPFQCFGKLYDSLVQPIISYGAAIWGHTQYRCIDQVQYRASSYFLGVGHSSIVWRNWMESATTSCLDVYW